MLFVREKAQDLPGGELGAEGEEGDMTPHPFRAALRIILVLYF